MEIILLITMIAVSAIMFRSKEQGNHNGEKWNAQQYSCYVWIAVQILAVKDNNHVQWINWKENVESFGQSLGNIEKVRSAVNDLSRQITGIEIVLPNLETQTLTLAAPYNIASLASKLMLKIGKNRELDCSKVLEIASQQKIDEESLRTAIKEVLEK